MLFNSLLILAAFGTAAADVELAAHWDCAEGRDRHVKDRSGNGNHGLIEGNVGWVELDQGYALDFSEGGGRVVCAASPSMDIRGPVSLSAWILPTGPAPSETGICGKSFTSFGLTFYTDGNVYWYVSSGGNKCSAPLDIRRWSHAVGTFDGETLRLYLDGVLVDSSESQFENVNPGGDFYIGCIGKGAPTETFRGLVDNVRLYRGALDAGTIAAQFKEERTDYPGPPARFDRIVLEPYPYLDEGRIVLDGDFSFVYPLREGERIVAELRRADGQAVFSADLPDIPATGYLEEAELEVGELPPGDYVLHVAVATDSGVRAEAEHAFTHPMPRALPDPRENVVPPPEGESTPEFTVEPGSRGGFTILAADATFPVESTYSYPHGGFNGLTPDGAALPGQEEDWRVDVAAVKENRFTVRARGRFYDVARAVEWTDDRVLVRDTFTNRTDAVLGVLINNHIRLAGLEQPRTSTPPNPSVFVETAAGALGMLALDDVYLEQYATYSEDARCGIRSDRFGLDAGASYTLEWALYPVAGGYYEFVNRARHDLGYAPHIEGGFAFVSREEPPTEEYVRARNLRYASLPCLGHVVDEPGLSIEGVEFVEYPKECAKVKGILDAYRDRYPEMNTMFHVAHSLYTTNRPEELFPESRVLNAEGQQTDYGHQNLDYYRKYFSEEHVQDGYRWYIFYPNEGNRFGPYMLEAIDYMLAEMGANSLFADGFTHGYGGRFTYDRWDGHTVDIDPETKLVTRKYASVNLLAQGILAETCRKVEEAGGVVIANSYPGTRTVHDEHILYCLETAAGGKVCSRLHFAPSVIALGNPSRAATARQVYRDALDKLAWGAVYFYYGEGTASADALVPAMFPITVTDIGPGTVKGPERIITMHSGVYGWERSRRLHYVHHFDGRGRQTPHDFVTTVDEDGVRTQLDLAENASAVIVPVPMELHCNGPANVAVREWDGARTRIDIAANGQVRLSFEEDFVPTAVEVDGQTIPIEDHEAAFTVEGRCSISIDNWGQ